MSILAPDKGKDGKRRYGVWAGDKVGRIEDPTRCIARVMPWPGYVSAQCSRKRGHGPDGEFCKQHAKKA